jgi:hypothetical protein
MSARATAIAVVALLVLGVALIAQAWRMKDYSLNVSIARERQDDDPEMLRNYQRYLGTGTTPDWVRRGDSRSAALLPASSASWEPPVSEEWPLKREKDLSRLSWAEGRARRRGARAECGRVACRPRMSGAGTVASSRHQAHTGGVGVRARIAARARSSWRSTVRSVMPSRVAVSRWLWPAARSAETSRLALPSAPVARPAGAVFGAT